MIIVIPLAGASSRFYDAGYTVPKYRLPLGNETVFDKSVKSFETYFPTSKFVFVIREDDHGSYEFVKTHATQLDIYDFEIIKLPKITKGQAETVYKALAELNVLTSLEQLVIFNIDTIRKNLIIPNDNYNYFDAFYDEDADESKWSFCKVDKDMKCILETAEKKKISCWCSTGLYIFAHLCQFVHAYNTLSNKKKPKYNYYIAPLYNLLIPSDNLDNTCKLLKCNDLDIEFAGVPDEYEFLVNKYNKEKIN